MPLPVRDYDRTLNAEVERLIYQVESIQLEAEGVLFGLDEDQFNWSPAPGRWSVGQCIEHLNITNQAMTGAIGKAVAEGRAAGKLHDGPYTYGCLTRWFYGQVSSPSKGRFQAPKAIRPATRVSLAGATRDWQEQHQRLLELLRMSNGLDLARIKVVSPFLSLLKYELGMSCWILTAHDRRHLAQARQVRNQPAFPDAVSAPASPRKD